MVNGVTGFDVEVETISSLVAQVQINSGLLAEKLPNLQIPLLILKLVLM